MKKSQAYFDKLRASIKKNNGNFTPNIGYEKTEWDARIFRCAYRILSGICFRESAESSYKKTGSNILPLT